MFIFVVTSGREVEDQQECVTFMRIIGLSVQYVTEYEAFAINKVKELKDKEPKLTYWIEKWSCGITGSEYVTIKRM